MSFAAYRKSLGLSQEQCALELGLTSKGHISGIEGGSQPASLRLGLQIQIWSAGAIQAVDVVSADDRRLLQDAARFADRVTA